MADLRSKRQKVQELYDRATSPGEKAAAKAALDRMAPEPAASRPQPSTPYQPPTGQEARPAGYKSRWRPIAMDEWGDPLYEAGDRVHDVSTEDLVNEILNGALRRRGFTRHKEK